MMRHRRTCAVALTLASVSLGSMGPAQAAGFDGPWNMIAVTTRGHCGTIDIGLAVNSGRLHATGGFFAFYPIAVSGRVSDSGHVRMTAVAGPRTARGTGRFARGNGSGTWSGKGPSGLCSGVWRASRT